MPASERAAGATPARAARVRLQVRAGTYAVNPEAVAIAMMVHAFGYTDKLEGPGPRIRGRKTEAAEA